MDCTNSYLFWGEFYLNKNLLGLEGKIPLPKFTLAACLGFISIIYHISFIFIMFL